MLKKNDYLSGLKNSYLSFSLNLSIYNQVLILLILSFYLQKWKIL